MGPWGSGHVVNLKRLIPASSASAARNFAGKCPPPPSKGSRKSKAVMEQVLGAATSLGAQAASKGAEINPVCSQAERMVSKPGRHPAGRRVAFGPRGRVWALLRGR